MSTEPVDTPLLDWRSPQFWTHAIAQLIACVSMFGLLTLAEGEQLKDISAKILGAAGIIGAQVAVIITLIRQRRQPPTPPPAPVAPPTPLSNNLLDRSKFTGMLALLLLIGLAGASRAEESVFIPAESRTSRTSTEKTCLFGKSASEKALEKQLAEISAKLDRLQAQIESERRYAPPILVLPPGGVPRIEFSPGGPPLLTPPPGGPPMVTPPPGGPPGVTPGVPGPPKLDLSPGGTPRAAPAPSPATGMMRYSLYRPRGVR